MSIVNNCSVNEKTLIQNSTLYQDISNDLQALFTDNSSLESLEKLKKNISLLVSTILDDSFKFSSFLSILNNIYFTHTHSLNVSIYAICLGKHMGFSQTLLEDLGLSALLHDIGKSKICESLLYKNGKLTDQEFFEVSQHSLYGWEILKNLGINDERILQGVKNHHEKLDGSGYPDALKEKEIALFARVIAICDVFDALSTQKKHKDSYSTFNTLQLMKLEMNQHLDSTLINHFILILKEESGKL